MDFTRLNNEFKIFWKSHNYNSALGVIQDIKDFFGEDFSFFTNKQILDPEYLVRNYYLTTGLQISDIIARISYTELINNFKKYLNGLVKEITDNRLKLDAMNKVSAFEKLISGIGDFFGIITNPIFLVAILGFLSLYLIKK